MLSASPTTRRIARIATLSAMAVALLLLVFVAGPGHFAFHVEGADSDCTACHFAAVELAAEPVLEGALEPSGATPEAIYRALFAAHTPSAGPPRAPPLG